MMPAGHPSPAQLVLHQRELAPLWLDDHLDACARCRTIAPADREPAPALRLPDHGVPGGLRDRLAEPMPEPFDPELNELWRVEWDGLAQVGLVAAVDESLVELFPVDLFPEAADDEVAVFPPDATVLGCELTVWLHDRVAVPRFVMDRRLDALELGDGGTVSTAAPSSMSDALLSLRRLAMRAENAISDPGQDSLIGQLVRDAGVRRADLVDAGFRPEDASLIIQGRRSPPPEELVTLARVLRLDPARLEAAVGTPVGALMVELHKPARRHALRERSSRQRRPEPEVRLRVAREVEAVRNRTAPGTTIDWAAAVDDYFAHDDA